MYAGCFNPSNRGPWEERLRVSFFFFVFGRLSKLNGKFLSDRYSDAHQTRTYRICGTTNFLFSSGIPKNLPVQARTAPVRMSSDLHTKSTKQARIRIRTRAHDSPIHTHSQTHIATDWLHHRPPRSWRGSRWLVERLVALRADGEWFGKAE